MKFERKYTKEGKGIYEDMAFKKTNSEIRNPDGTIVFKLENIEVPENWSQVGSNTPKISNTAL